MCAPFPMTRATRAWSPGFPSAPELGVESHALRSAAWCCPLCPSSHPRAEGRPRPPVARMEAAAAAHGLRVVGIAGEISSGVDLSRSRLRSLLDHRYVDVIVVEIAGSHSHGHRGAHRGLPQERRTATASWSSQRSALARTRSRKRFAGSFSTGLPLKQPGPRPGDPARRPSRRDGSHDEKPAGWSGDG